MPLGHSSTPSPEDSDFYSPATSSRNHVKKEHILIVDDSPVVRKAFVQSLRAKYDCSEAESVAEAFELLKRAEFELVITDIIMPGMSGIELLRRVIDSYPKTAVIVVSGVDRPQRALDAVRLGAFDYLIKPCDAGVLELTVERALERRSLLINALTYKRDLEERNEQLVRGKAQLERLQAQIVQSEKMASIGQLAAGIAHEVNNPVGFVHGNLDILDGCIKDLLGLLKFYDDAVDMPSHIATEAEAIKRRIHYEDTRSDLSSIITDCREGTSRIKDIVQNLKTFSRLDEAEFKKTEIHEGIDSTIRLLSRYLSGGNISLVRDYGDLPEIDAYSSQLNQVWMNLLVNAAQAIGSVPGEVRISTRADESTVTVAISDTGNGIEPDALSKIFDPFFTTKPVGEGTGLGLSITFGIVARHGGKVEVKSEVNKGTTFSVTLPQRIEAQSTEITTHVPLTLNQTYAI